MNNIEKIKAAYAMNYAAQLKLELQGDAQVVGIYNEEFLLKFKDDWDCIDLNFYDFKITSYLYMGQLGGNEPVPEGQRFRVKETGTIQNFIKQFNEWECTLVDDEGISFPFHKSEIEPVFE